jgi:hypothetical protein
MRDFDPEFQQLTVNAWYAPQRKFRPRHLVNQLRTLEWNRRFVSVRDEGVTCIDKAFRESQLLLVIIGPDWIGPLEGGRATEP